MTPLERELPRSVSELADCSKEETAALRRSLTICDQALNEGVESRLSAFERRREELKT
ncbi:MAG: hypothetical protein V6Z86_00880 [Hyphomicrobiales bacterium]